MGTGNDLSRSLNWGGKYRDKPLRKVLIDIAKADIVNMDRWTLHCEQGEDSSSPANVQPSNEDFNQGEAQLVMLAVFFVGYDPTFPADLYVFSWVAASQRTQQLLFGGDRRPHSLAISPSSQQ